MNDQHRFCSISIDNYLIRHPVFMPCHSRTQTTNTQAWICLCLCWLTASHVQNRSRVDSFFCCHRRRCPLSSDLWLCPVFPSTIPFLPTTRNVHQPHRVRRTVDTHTHTHIPAAHADNAFAGAKCAMIAHNSDIFQLVVARRRRRSRRRCRRLHSYVRACHHHLSRSLQRSDEHSHQTHIRTLALDSRHIHQASGRTPS